MRDEQEAGPLAGVHVLDLTDGLGELCTRYLGDLGADVVRVEPPGVDGLSLRYLTYNVNKRSAFVEPGADKLWPLLAWADIVVSAGHAGVLQAAGLSPESILDRYPEKVVVTISDFGSSGPYRDWVGSDAVHYALSGVLARSGLPGREPLLPPGPLPSESTALQAAWVAVATYLHRLRTGRGDWVDISVFEATAEVIDPTYGLGGSATSGNPRGRPDARLLYPIYGVTDGWVRICVLSPRQWAGMWKWMGEPEELADPALSGVGARWAASARIHEFYERHFARLTRDGAVAEGQAHGVPIAGVLTLAEALQADHYAARQAFVEVAAPGRPPIRIPNGLVEIDGRRAGIRRPAPRPGEHTADVQAELARPRGGGPAGPDEPQPQRPLDGMVVLDLGVIIVGAELGRLLADMGADVIKVENRAFPDGSRQLASGEAISVPFAQGHRNKRSLGLNLRDPRGRDLFLALAARADVILSNFKPGTMDSLGLSYQEIAAVNPGIVMADSSALGSTGPWSQRMGYGPLVRASAGLSMLWRYPDDEASFSDATTIFPDHIAARVGAAAVAAKLVERRRTGRGGTVSVAQTETIFNELTSEVASESLHPGRVKALGNELAGDAPRGVFPCAGDDEWIAITIRDTDDFRRLAAVMARADLASDPRYADPGGRVAARADLEGALTAWTREREPGAAAEQLQAAGIPAGMMHRPEDLLSDPHLLARRFLTWMSHPHLARRPIPTGRAPAVFLRLPDPPLGPAPLMGEHTREIARQLLGLDDGAIAGLVAAGVLEE
jgi:crotonobetainyl-CoA:carnitine CoA-transferase CaiB-like acyl-CoA transferase